MANAGRNHNTHASFDGNDLVIQLHLRVGAAFQEVVRFRKRFVVVLSGIFTDLRHVQGAGKRVHVREGSSSGPAGAGNAFNVRKVGKVISRS